MSEYTLLKCESVYQEDAEGSFQKNRHIVINQASGMIVKIGDPREVEEWLESNLIFECVSRSYDVVLPGFTDSHTHLSFGIMGEVQAGFVFGVKSHLEMLTRIKEVTAGDASFPKLIIGHNSTHVPDMDLAHLDSISSERPLILVDVSYHGAIVNSRMLLIFKKGVDSAKKQGRQFSGKINEETGKITGSYVFFAIELVESYFGEDALVQGVMGICDVWMKSGITSLHDLMPLSWTDVRVFLKARKAWIKERRTAFPMTQMFMPAHLLEMFFERRHELAVSGLIGQDEVCDFVGLKLFADGAIGAYTALMKKPFSDGMGGVGEIFNNWEVVHESVKIALKYRVFRVAIHAIGDAGIEYAVNIARYWRGEARSQELASSWIRIEHFTLSQDSISEAARLGIQIACQPNFLTDNVYKDRLGERAKEMCLHGSMHRRGIVMMFGSDGMPSSPLFGIWCAVNHPVPEERISLPQAIHNYSRTAAQYEVDATRGKIGENCFADLVCISKEGLQTIQCAGVDGENLFDKLSDSAWTQSLISRLHSSIESVYKTGKKIA